MERKISMHRVRWMKGVLSLIVFVEGWAQSKSLPDSETGERLINIDVGNILGPFNPIFKECLGAGRSNEGLRADWQQPARGR